MSHQQTALLSGIGSPLLLEWLARHRSCWICLSSTFRYFVYLEVFGHSCTFWLSLSQMTQAQFISLMYSLALHEQGSFSLLKSYFLGNGISGLNIISFTFMIKNPLVVLLRSMWLAQNWLFLLIKAQYKKDILNSWWCSWLFLPFVKCRSTCFDRIWTSQFFDGRQLFITQRQRTWEPLWWWSTAVAN